METLASVNRGMKYTTAQVHRIDKESELRLIKNGIIQSIHSQQKFSKSCEHCFEF
jgi:hypothetical protein